MPDRLWQSGSGRVMMIAHRYGEFTGANGRTSMTIRACFAAVVLLAAPSLAAQSLAQTSWPNQREGDFVIKDFMFASGEKLGELKLHYTTLGTPKRNAAG